MKKVMLSILLCGVSLAMTSSWTSRTVDAEEILNVPVISDYVNSEEDGTVEFLVPEEEVDRDLQTQVQDFISSKTGMLRSPTYVNLTQKVIETKYPVASGYAGNQPTKGTKFPSGGGFYWSSGGGPNVSVSAGFAGVSISTNLGKSGTSGSFVNAPNKTKYFKLHVSEKYKVQKVAVYGAPYTNPNGPKQFLYYTYPKSLYSRTLSAKAQ
ncbi:hypothetical protein [Enterococcus gallinarum]|uniref:hypothetical protein n=1 Tax=Enterococcus gallinarum TaxID=1353 RepID=UPI001D17753E|nr:hypothetical protein [Enterococcus gallinarum]MCC4044814.1 hypothetical protein [Enterococcus gallinarum]